MIGKQGLEDSCRMHVFCDNVYVTCANDVQINYTCP